MNILVFLCLGSDYIFCLITKLFSEQFFPCRTQWLGVHVIPTALQRNVIM
jgi:hypothetical protein